MHAAATHLVIVILSAILALAGTNVVAGAPEVQWTPQAVSRFDSVA
jgi:hypothetical protein